MSLQRLIDHELARFDTFALYPAEVVLQHDDGTVDVRVESTKIPGTSRVPIRLGLPGCSVKVKKGAQVLLGYEGGDPARPFVSLFRASDLEELSISASVKVSVVAPEVNLGDEGGLAVARQGDVVEFAYSPGPLQVTGTFNGAPITPGTGFLTLTDVLYGVISAPDIRTKAS